MLMKTNHLVTLWDQFMNGLTDPDGKIFILAPAGELDPKIFGHLSILVDSIKVSLRLQE